MPYRPVYLYYPMFIMQCLSYLGKPTYSDLGMLRV
jgi:hypothetical protein